MLTLGQAHRASFESGLRKCGPLNAAMGKNGNHIALCQGNRSSMQSALWLIEPIHGNTSHGLKQAFQTGPCILLFCNQKTQWPSTGRHQQQGIQSGNVIRHHDGRTGFREFQVLFRHAVITPAKQADQAIETIELGVVPIDAARCLTSGSEFPACQPAQASRNKQNGQQSNIQLLLFHSLCPRGTDSPI